MTQNVDKYSKDLLQPVGREEQIYEYSFFV